MMSNNLEFHSLYGHIIQTQRTDDFDAAWQIGRSRGYENDELVEGKGGTIMIAGSLLANISICR